MAELEFSERLKRLRKARGMTQQELADQLGVSNKSVSRWESGGGYPDVALLEPLARALGVTVDELLSNTPAVPRLGAADWQNLLSFAFAIGGGVLYFLLDLFMPTLVCYLLYLGAMAYGVYLQNRYTYHSRWFHGANLIMDFFVNIQLLAPVLPLLFAGRLSYASQLLWILQNREGNWGEALGGYIVPLLGPLALWFFLAAALTAVTELVVRDRSGGCTLALPRLERAPLTVRKLLPLLFPVALTAFWAVYRVDLGGETYIPAALPTWMYHSQGQLYAALWALCVLACVLLFWRRWGMLALSSGWTALLGVVLSALADRRFVLSIQGNMLMSSTTNTDYYTRFGAFHGRLLAAAGILAALYVLLCCARLARRGEGGEKTSSL